MELRKLAKKKVVILAINSLEIAIVMNQKLIWNGLLHSTTSSTTNFVTKDSKKLIILYFWKDYVVIVVII